MSKPIPPALFALKGWTIKQHAEKFYIAPTSAFEDKERWSKGYALLQAACSAISRKLAEEWTARNARRKAYDRIKRGCVMEVHQLMFVEVITEADERNRAAQDELKVKRAGAVRPADHPAEGCARSLVIWIGGLRRPRGSCRRRRRLVASCAAGRPHQMPQVGET